MAEDPDELVELARYRMEHEAAVVAAALADRGIDTVTTGGFTAAFKAEAPGYVSVQVRRKDLERARNLLAGLRDELRDIDWDQVDVGEPE